jgi:hypothetical protein
VSFLVIVARLMFVAQGRAFRAAIATGTPNRGMLVSYARHAGAHLHHTERDNDTANIMEAIRRA